MLQRFAFKALRIHVKSYHKKLDKVCADVGNCQENLLDKIISEYSGTQFSHDFGLKRKMNYDDFKRLIPVQTYESLYPYINNERQCKRESLLKSPAIKWERTSGSSGKEKWIPYNKYALRNFQNALFYWLSDLLKAPIPFKTGVVFYSFSPSIKNLESGEISDDSDYLPSLIKTFFSDYFIHRPELKLIRDPSEFRLYLGLLLLSKRDLETIFIWSPSYLLSLLGELESQRDFAMKLLRRDKYQFFTNERKSEVIANWGDYDFLWPQLKFISCWTEATASFFLPQMKKVFPNVVIQGKGLVATEAPMTIPLFGREGSLPLLMDIFFEFKNDNGQILRLHELIVGHTYSIIITNKSGLIRYEIGDYVRVNSYYNRVPLLEFIGRGHLLSDMTGEKLNELQVREILQKYLPASKFAFLNPNLSENPFYELISDYCDNSFLELVETSLLGIYHYKESRRLGQLDKLKLKIVPDVQRAYYDIMLDRGIKYGDIKFNTLVTFNQKK